MHPLLLAALIVLFEGLGLSALFPILYAHIGDLGGGPATTGLFFALVAGPKVLINPLWGWAADHVGRRPVLIVITLGTLGSSVGWALAPDLTWLAVARVATGIFGAQAVLAFAIAADVSPNQRAGGMAAIGAAFGIAMTIGPPLGGWLGKAYGYSEVGWLCAAFQLCSLVLIVAGLRETGSRSEPVGITSGWKQILGTPGVTPALGASLAMAASSSILIATLGDLTELLYSFEPDRVGMMFGVFGFVGALVQGGIRPAVARLGELTLGIVSLAVLSLGCVGLAMRPEMWLFWGAIVLVSIGASAATTCLSALLSNRIGADQQGRLMGLQQSANGLGRAFGFGMGGLALARLGPVGPGTLAAAIAVLGISMLLLIGKPRDVAHEQAPA